MASSISEAARRRAVAAVMLAIVTVEIGAMPAARAQAVAAAEAARASARRKLVEGVDAMKRGDYPTALARFEEAYALVPSPKIHYDFGLAYVGLERPAEALSAFERFLAEAPDAPPDKREKAASLVSALRARVAETARRDEHEASQVAAQPAGPSAAASGVPPGAVSPPLATAKSAESRGDEPTTAVTTTAERDPSRVQRITAITLGAAGVSLIAAGLVFGALAQRESDSLTNDSRIATDDHPTPFDAGKESRGLAYERLQIISLVAGGVAVAAGAVVYATTRRRVAVEPVAGSSLAGAALRVTF